MGIVISKRKNKSVHMRPKIDEKEFTSKIHIIIIKLTNKIDDIRIEQIRLKNKIIEYLRKQNILYLKEAFSLEGKYLINDRLVKVYELILDSLKLFKEWIAYLLSLHHMLIEIKPVLVTLLYASDKIDIEEFIYLREKLRIKYGNWFIESSLKNEEGIISNDIIEGFNLEPINDIIIFDKLKEIAIDNDIRIVDGNVNNIDDYIKSSIVDN